MFLFSFHFRSYKTVRSFCWEGVDIFDVFGRTLAARQDMQAKTDQIGAKAKATRDLMIKVEKAAAEHSKAGGKNMGQVVCR